MKKQEQNNKSVPLPLPVRVQKVECHLKGRFGDMIITIENKTTFQIRHIINQLKGVVQ